MTEVDVVIMAAGKGTRMKSRKPKVLHQLAGRALLRHVVDTVASLQVRSQVVVVGHGADEVERALAQPSSVDQALRFVRQEPQLGTGHAVQQAAPLLPDDGISLILNGDVPLIEAATLRELVRSAQAAGGLALLTVTMPDPSGYGRILRGRSPHDAADDGRVLGIVEHQDATAEQRLIQEIYTGVMALPTPWLKRWLARLSPSNAQGEYYLTDIVAFAVADGVPVGACRVQDTVQVDGVNDPAQLAALERAYQRRYAAGLMAQGVRLADPARLDVRGSLLCAADVEIDVNCVFEGQVSLGEGVHIGPHCVIADATVQAGAVIHAFSHIQGSAGEPVQVGTNARIGPFARLRPGTQLGPDVHVGNFVEIKNTSMGRGAKANHLAYLGDAQVGEDVNYGAGSITANYDGTNKHRTVIEAGAHIGSNCVLIAPLTVGAGATVGGGSTLTKNVPAGSLTVARAKQLSLPNWKRPAKKR